MKEVKLQNGAILKIGVAPFEVSRALYQAILEELKSVNLRSDSQLQEIYKDIFCLGFSSKKVEFCVWECMKRCTYNSGKGDLKIDGDTFEPIEARENYLTVCMEVAKENVSPFWKSLWSAYKEALAMAEGSQKSSS